MRFVLAILLAANLLVIPQQIIQEKRSASPTPAWLKNAPPEINLDQVSRCFAVSPQYPGEFLERLDSKTLKPWTGCPSDAESRAPASIARKTPKLNSPSSPFPMPPSDCLFIERDGSVLEQLDPKTLKPLAACSQVDRQYEQP